jgi:DNA-directed RNA polymerase subunit M
MIFCPKCGSLLKPSTVGSKKIMACSCGFKDKDTKDATIKEAVDHSAEPKVEVVNENQDMQSLPQVEEKCPECEHEMARFWTVQTRAADEPETKFFRCEKCKHTWRDYN